MKQKMHKILIVDDSPVDIQLLMENIKHEYAVLVATNGTKALEIAAQENKPSVILMDIMMPEMDGYETCRHLKNNPETENIPVIFVSAHDTTEEKLSGYEAGGSDYLIKPILPAEVLQKIHIAIKDQETHNELQLEKNIAIETAMTAMSNTGELGIILNFLRQSFTLSSLDDLGRFIVETIHGGYNLDCSIQIRSTLGTSNYGTNEPISPLEKELHFRLKDRGRILEHRRRLILNFGDISALIKNMPIDDSESCGRIRDNLCILIEGSESKLREIELHLLHEHERKHGLRQIIRDSNQALTEIGKKQIENKEKSMQLMDDVLAQLEKSFLGLSLTEIQEIELLKIVQNGVNGMQDNFEQGLKMDEKITNIVNNLQKYVN